LIHAYEGIVYVEERNVYGVAITSYLRDLSTKELGSENRRQEGHQKHENDEVQETTDISKNNHLAM